MCYLVRVRSSALSHAHSLSHTYTLFLYFVLQSADLGNLYMLNTKVNGAFLVDTSTDLSKVREIHTASFARFAEIGDVYSPYVTLDTSDGKRLGIKLMKNPATGAGAAIKSVDSGGQAESTGKVYVGQVITHVNGTDVTEMAFKEITSLIEDSTTIVFRLASVPVQASKGKADEGLDDTSSCCCSQKTSVGQTKEEGSMIAVANRNFEGFEVRKTDVISNVSTILDPNGKKTYKGINTRTHKAVELPHDGATLVSGDTDYKAISNACLLKKEWKAVWSIDSTTMAKHKGEIDFVIQEIMDIRAFSVTSENWTGMMAMMKGLYDNLNTLCRNGGHSKLIDVLGRIIYDEKSAAPDKRDLTWTTPRMTYLYMDSIKEGFSKSKC